MGFLSVSVKMPCFGIKFLVASIYYFKTVFIVALTHLRLLKPPQQAYTREEEANDYVLVINRLCPIPVSVPIDVLTALVKKRLVVRKFSSILSRLGKDEDEVCMCPVCLDSINKTHEIRELCNCAHVFHKECLDTWVDEGQVTCPLCRSMLFPDNILTATAEDPWITQRNALFSGTDSDSAIGEN
eukprot:XP_015574458.1 RING-H2 finger protein ATL54 [Ricinus communis]